MKSFISSLYCNFLSFRQWVKACHVMVIYLSFSIFWVSTVIAQPSVIKSPTAIPRNEIAKLSNGSLQNRESGLKEGIFVSRPVNDYWIESSKLAEDSGAELSRSGVVSIKSNVSEAAENSDESAENGDDCLYQFSVILVIIMNSGFLAILNAQRFKSPTCAAFRVGR